MTTVVCTPNKEIDPMNDEEEWELKDGLYRRGAGVICPEPGQV